MPVEVGIVTVQSAVKPFVRELPGRISPTRIAEVRARVSGIVMARTFQQGADVKAGDVLYRIDPAPFEVELQASEAALAKAQAVLEQATQQAKRIDTLVAGRVASQVQHETSIANLRQAEADVAARTADVSAPASTSNTPPCVRRSAAASDARWSPKARWSVRAKRPIWRPSSSSTRSTPTSRNRSASSTSFAAISRRATSKPSRPRPPRCGWSSTTARSIRTPAGCCSPTPPSIRPPAR